MSKPFLPWTQLPLLGSSGPPCPYSVLGVDHLSTIQLQIFSKLLLHPGFCSGSLPLKQQVQRPRGRQSKVGSRSWSTGAAGGSGTGSAETRLHSRVRLHLNSLHGAFLLVFSRLQFHAPSLLKCLLDSSSLTFGCASSLPDVEREPSERILENAARRSRGSRGRSCSHLSYLPEHGPQSSEGLGLGAAPVLPDKPKSWS